MIDRVEPETPVDFVRADLADTDAAEQAVHEIIERAGGRIDGVFTAAGTDACGPLDKVPTKKWEYVVQVNLFGTAAVIRAALPALRESKGTVVTCASTLGIKAVGDATAYCASKFGVVGFTRALAAETAGSVGVTLLIPGECIPRSSMTATSSTSRRPTRNSTNPTTSPPRWSSR